MLNADFHAMHEEVQKLPATSDLPLKYKQLANVYGLEAYKTEMKRSATKLTLKNSNLSSNQLLPSDDKP